MKPLFVLAVLSLTLAPLAMAGEPSPTPTPTIDPCAPTPTPSVTPTPDPSPTVDPCPTPTEEHEDDRRTRPRAVHNGDQSETRLIGPHPARTDTLFNVQHHPNLKSVRFTYDEPHSPRATFTPLDPNNPPAPLPPGTEGPTYLFDLSVDSQEGLQSVEIVLEFPPGTTPPETILRWDGNSWQAVQLTTTIGPDGTVTVMITTPGLSVFALGHDAPEVTDAMDDTDDAMDDTDSMDDGDEPSPFPLLVLVGAVLFAAYMRRR